MSTFLDITTSNNFYLNLPRSMNHRHHQNTVSCLLTHTKSDILPPTEEELTQFPIDKTKTRRCCYDNSFFTKKKKKPLFGTRLHHGEGRQTNPSSLIFLSRLLHCFIHRVLFFLFRLNTMILSLKCLLFLVIVFTVLRNCVSAEEEQQPDTLETLAADRFYDKDFLANNWVYKRNVTCGQQSKTVFTSRTWTCANIRVNGRKIAYGHYPFKSGYPYPMGRCFETQGRDDIGGICLGLMENVNETAKLWVASITNATCGHTKDERVLLTVDTSQPENPQYVWIDLGDGFGWVETLHCLTLPDEF